jgi:glycosyltransferase involved in cell wall biosynthesis
MGSYHSRNTGVRIAQGNVVAFTDSDCIVPTNWLAKIHKAFQNEEILCLQGAHERRGKWELPIPKEQVLDHPVFSVRKGLDTRNLAIRKDLLSKYGFDVNSRFSADVDLGHRLAADHINVKFDPEIWVTHIDPRGFWEAISKGQTRGRAYAWLYKKHGWKSVNPKLGCPLWILFLYYLGSFFYFLLRYRSFRGSLTTAVINLASAAQFKKTLAQS